MEFFIIILLLIIIGLSLWKNFYKPKSDKIQRIDDVLEKELRQQIEQLNEEKSDLGNQYTDSEKQNAALKEKLNNLETFKDQSKAEFKNIAQEILEKNNKVFEEQSVKNIKHLLNPLDTQLKDFKNELTGFKAINEKMTFETESLTNALTSNVKVQGDWGEITLERILEQSGLQKGKEYIVQGIGLELKSADGRHQKPDVIVKLPDQQSLVIDSKVTLKSYIDYHNTEDKDSKSIFLKAFIDSIKVHIKGLSLKEYEMSDGLSSPNFVLMFMPMEAAYMLAMQTDESLLSLAWKKNIAIVCPSTLMVNLRTISSLWRLQQQNENAKEIARLGGTIYDKVSGFLENMNKVGKKLQEAQTTHDDALKQLAGHGSVLSQTKKLKELGAKTSKSLPSQPDNHLE